MMAYAIAPGSSNHDPSPVSTGLLEDEDWRPAGWWPPVTSPPNNTPTITLTPTNTFRPTNSATSTYTPTARSTLTPTNTRTPTRIDTPLIPVAPALHSPANNALVTSNTPRLGWNDVAFDDHNHLQLGMDAAVTALVLDEPNITPSEFTPAIDLSPTTKDYWHVQACNSQGPCSAWSPVRSFRTALPVPISLSADGSTQDLHPGLTWNMPFYPLPIPTNYTVQFSRNSSVTQVVLTGTATSVNYTPSSDLPYNLPRYWHVRANGTNGPGAWSGFGSIATGNPPSTPNLLSPPGNTLVSSHTLCWTGPARLSPHEPHLSTTTSYRSLAILAFPARS